MTAIAIAAAKTDGERTISYEPARRPEVSNLVMLTALCLDTPPERVADDIGARGSGALKAVLADALNERLRPIRARRRELIDDCGYRREVLAEGNQRAREIADTTLREVRTLMHTDY